MSYDLERGAKVAGSKFYFMLIRLTHTVAKTY